MAQRPTGFVEQQHPVIPVAPKRSGFSKSLRPYQCADLAATLGRFQCQMHAQSGHNPYPGAWSDEVFYGELLSEKRGEKNGRGYESRL
ncbi:uncharacterized protein PADG_11358 [Paracoccidioides brasiliensis Pb18]|uniref:Uncharacterized protein n=1 Tax=Paracoccidioides brasiliensis (strain Pb18) TaxID=502780 RepID=A0A0A0HYT6_PARBD|nr:uncharacterized protein PADG_11358 [Paracoccidioides brasiliensis Pb18]KGM92530.1 hypothetical protein PADG_11358 [Paracoccidioides brasiliensis Pb18]